MHQEIRTNLHPLTYINYYSNYFAFCTSSMFKDALRFRKTADFDTCRFSKNIPPNIQTYFYLPIFIVILHRIIDSIRVIAVPVISVVVVIAIHIYIIISIIIRIIRFLLRRITLS